MKTALIIFSHGSVLAQAGQLMERHAQWLRHTGDYAAVETGYLNYSEPPIETAAEAVMATHPDLVAVVPYFLVAGKFVREDLRPRFDSVAGRYPQTPFVLTPPLENIAVMDRVVRELLPQAVPLAQWRLAPADAPVAISSAPYTQHDWAAAAVLLILHGSPYEQANEPARRLAQQMTAAGVAGRVVAAFLDCCTPTIGDAIDDCARHGFHRIIAVPWFLHTGKHLKRDIPALFDAALVRHPEVTLVATPPAGTATAMAEVVHARAMQAIANH